MNRNDHVASSRSTDRIQDQEFTSASSGAGYCGSGSASSQSQDSCAAHLNRLPWGSWVAATGYRPFRPTGTSRSAASTTRSAIHRSRSDRRNRTQRAEIRTTGILNSLTQCRIVPSLNPVNAATSLAVRRILSSPVISHQNGIGAASEKRGEIRFRPYRSVRRISGCSRRLRFPAGRCRSVLRLQA